MSFSSFMHPRNPFKDTKPNFRQLAERYEKFRAHTMTDDKGNVHVDFKNPEALRALSWALLKDRFTLDVEMPIDRLIPTIPLRLNYILWLEDILEASFPDRDQADVWGIDIGTGASCIYALLGAVKNGWKFVATDADATNIEYAQSNVANNSLSHKITVLQVNEECSLSEALTNVNKLQASSILGGQAVRQTNEVQNDTLVEAQIQTETRRETYDFCMCNPPFYGSNLEAWGLECTRTDRRAEPRSVSTASPVESIYPGGEVQFISQSIIDCSVELRDTVRIYSTMLGKKQSLVKLKQVLRDRGISNYGWTEFCQGKTMRWGLAWSFHPSVIFPKSQTQLLREQQKQQQPVRPAAVQLPEALSSCSIEQLSAYIQRYLSDLQTVHSMDTQTQGEIRWIVCCPAVTWTNQRKLRRQLKRTSAEASSSPDKSSQSQALLHANTVCEISQFEDDQSQGRTQFGVMCKRQRLDENSNQSQAPTHADTVCKRPWLDESLTSKINADSSLAVNFYDKLDVSNAQCEPNAAAKFISGENWDGITDTDIITSYNLEQEADNMVGGHNYTQVRQIHNDDTGDCKTDVREVPDKTEAVTVKNQSEIESVTHACTGKEDVIKNVRDVPVNCVCTHDLPLANRCAVRGIPDSSSSVQHMTLDNYNLSDLEDFSTNFNGTDVAVKSQIDFSKSPDTSEYSAHVESNHTDSINDNISETGLLQLQQMSQRLSQQQQMSQQQWTSQQKLSPVQEADQQVFVCRVCVVLKQMKSEGVRLEVEWVEGENREQLHQIAQYIKNRLSQESSITISSSLSEWKESGGRAEGATTPDSSVH